jgi:hypothetical protein
MPENNNWKTITYIIGGLIGLAAGVASAHLLIKNSENIDGKLSLTSKEKLNLGMSLVTFLRQIAEFGKVR